jgi:hypothetical protein
MHTQTGRMVRPQLAQARTRGAPPLASFPGHPGATQGPPRGHPGTKAGAPGLGPLGKLVGVWLRDISIALVRVGLHNISELSMHVLDFVYHR